MSTPTQHAPGGRQEPVSVSMPDAERTRLQNVIREYEAGQQRIVIEVTTMSAIRDRLASIDLPAYVRAAFDGAVCDEMDGVESADEAEEILATCIRGKIHRPLTEHERAMLGMEVVMAWNRRQDALAERNWEIRMERRVEDGFVA